GAAHALQPPVLIQMRSMGAPEQREIVVVAAGEVRRLGVPLEILRGELARAVRDSESVEGARPRTPLVMPACLLERGRDRALHRRILGLPLIPKRAPTCPGSSSLLGQLDTSP